MIFSLLSIPHSGTRFLRNNIFPDCDEVPYFSSAPGYTFDHIDPWNYCNVISMLDVTTRIIIPLRHPARVHKSWEKRGREHQMDRMWAGWSLLAHSLSKNFTVKYIVIDGPNRELQASVIRRYLSLPEISIDWTPFKSKDGDFNAKTDVPIPSKLLEFYQDCCNSF